MKLGTLRNALMTLGFWAYPVIGALSLLGASYSPKQMEKGKGVHHMLQVLRDKSLRETAPDKVAEAIRAAGESKVEEAIPDLVDLLTFSVRFHWEREDMVNEIQPITIGARYPAAGALFQIGRPSLAALIHVVQHEDPVSLKSQNAAYTLMMIFRERPSDGIRYLLNAAKAAESPEASSRLKIAAEKQKQIWQKAIEHEPKARNTSL